MGHKTNDFAADFGFGAGTQYIRRGHTRIIPETHRPTKTFFAAQIEENGGSPPRGLLLSAVLANG
jgi:hypothetical protein